MLEGWRGWDHLVRIDELKFMYSWRGVYAIRLIDAPSGKPIPIGRFLGINESGILLIGVSNDLGRRLHDFYYSCLEDRRTHSEGSRLFLVRFMTQFEGEIYPDASMQFGVKRILDEEQAKHEEERLLKSYFRRFGELPPLNTRMEKQRVTWTGTDTEGNYLW
jgi:hypothetical protein